VESTINLRRASLLHEILQCVPVHVTIKGRAGNASIRKVLLNGGNDMLRYVSCRVMAFSVVLLPLLSGCPGTNTESVLLRNDSNQNIHILGPGEDFSPTNRLVPAASGLGRNSRRIELPPGTHTFLAGENGVVTTSQSCTVEAEFITLTVAYTGEGLQCIQEPI
jgi:hypothetical protein